MALLAPVSASAARPARAGSRGRAARGGPVRGPGKTAMEWAQDNRHREVEMVLAEACGLPAETALEDPAHSEARSFAQAAETPEFRAILQHVAEVCGRSPTPWRKRRGVYSCSLRGLDEQQHTQLQAEVAASGFLLVSTHDAAESLLFPTSDKYAVVVAHGTNGANYGLSTRAIIAWLRNFEAENPFELSGCGFDFLSGRLLGPINHAQRWAERLFDFCPDCGSPDEILAGFEQGMFELWWD